MRTVYATTLTVREQIDANAALNLVGTWIQNWYRRLRITIDWPIASTADFEITPKPPIDFQSRDERGNVGPSQYFWI